MTRAIVMLTLGCALISVFAPWWCYCALITFQCLFCPRLNQALSVGFAAGFLLWAGWPLLLHFTGHGVLAPRLGATLPWWPLIFLVNGMMGGLLGAVSGWLGFSLRRVIFSSAQQ